MPATSMPASEPSTRWRRALPRWAACESERVRCLAGARQQSAVLGGSLFMSSYVRSYGPGDPSAGIQRVEQLRVALVYDVAL